jgi:uncharacterized protein (DUF433 family)
MGWVWTASGRDARPRSVVRPNVSSPSRPPDSRQTIRFGLVYAASAQSMVTDVLSSLAAGMTVAEVLDDFRYLTPEDIQACFAFAADRKRSMLVVTT